MTRDDVAPAGHDVSSIPVVPANFQTFLAIDLGQKRTGIAVGTRMLKTATPQGTVRAEGDARFALIEKYIHEWQPDALVIGVPVHPDGAPHDNTRLAQKFARQLRGRFNLQVYEVDERYSTTEAAAGAPRDIDAASAGIILEQFLGTLS